MLRLLRHLVVVLFVLFVASCSGGGCSSGCSGCGTTPLPGGFKKADTIANAASVRVTRSGLDFIAANLPSIASQVAKANNGVLTFDVPKSDQSTTILFIKYNIHICPNGPNHGADPPECVVEINIAGMKLHVDSITPHALKVTGTVPVRLRDLPVDADVIGRINVGLGNGSCNGDTPQFDYKDIPVDVELPLINTTTAPRDGYTKIDVDNAVINVTVDKNDVSICKGCGFAQAICDGIFGLIKDFAFNTLIGGVQNQIKSALKSGVCTKPTPNVTPSCPTGSHDDNGTCVFDSDGKTCVPTELGTDGHIDLSGALKSISPGTVGGLDFGLASGGDMDPAPGLEPDDTPYAGHTPNGITLGMIGGTLPQPQSSCVPTFANVPPTGIPIPDEMVKDKQTPWPAADPTGPHLGIALAGRFLNHSLASVYNSGLLCLGVSTEQVNQLNSGLLSVLIPSIKKLTIEQKGAPVAITTRPQAPPTLKIGGGTDIKKDPLLLVQIPKFSIDFYVWSYDRFVRAFTLNADVTVPVNIQTGKDPKTNPNGGLLPVLGDLGLSNATVTNTDLLTDDPAQIASALSAILQGFAGQFLGNGFKPIDLSSSLKSLGLSLTIPDGGIRKLHKGNDDFLAIFADLGAQPSKAIVEADVQAKIVQKIVHAEAMGLTTASDEKMPELRLEISSALEDGRHAVEYSYWIDDGTHSAWAPRDASGQLRVQDRYLFLQGKHVLHVTAREVGQPDTEDSTPLELPFVIDTLAPYVTVTRTNDGEASVTAWDIVSNEADLRGRWRTTGGDMRLSAWSDWMPLDQMKTIAVPGAISVDVEVSDEEANVGRISQGLIRGRGDATLSAAGSGCGCSVPGAASNSGTTLAASLAVLGALIFLVMRRQKRAALALSSLCAVAATSQGCACGSSDSGNTGTGCGSDCNQPCQSAIPMGMVGAYLSLAKAKDGTVWAAGYNDAVLSNGDNYLYGDLVVGKYDQGKSAVGWRTVDGLPPKRTDGTCPDNDPAGWRNGETDAGDDVGLWTSIQLNASDNPMVAYYDITHGALKFASSGDGGQTWDVHVVSQAANADIGRYAKLLLVDGKPVIAYLVMEPGNGGKMRSKVTLARASSESPKATGDWTMEDVAINEDGPCRASLCSGAQVCIKDTGQCEDKIDGCSTQCGNGQACVSIDSKAACGTIIADTSTESYPNAFGDYISLANGPSGLGLVFYDRIHGNLMASANVGGGWKTSILDGETGTRGKDAVDTGDDGIGASLFIDATNQWHVSYVDGISETLKYLVAQDAANPKIEPVDDGDGQKTLGAAFPDGKHVVGDDSFIAVDGDTITIAYQDATAGTLRVAVGTPTQGGHTWAIKAVSQNGKFAGFFPHPVPGGGSFANYWRATDPSSKDINADVAFVSP